MNLRTLSIRVRPVILGAAALLVPSLVEAQTWKQHALTTVLPNREDHATAVEAGTGNLLVFGGLQLPAGTLLGDTQIFDGFHWMPQFPLTSPGPRVRSAMATDTARGVTVLFGGDSFGPVNDTWQWNGTNWTQFPPALPAPIARSMHAMAFDPLAGVVVLFGGNNGGSLGDTWLFNGISWTQIALVGGPPARENHTLEFDPLTGRILLFGGISAATGTLNDTWTLNTVAGVWTNLTPVTSPTPREDHAMVFDTGLNRMVLTGGANGATTLGDQWTWNGTNWAKATFNNAAPARRAHSLDLGPRSTLTAVGGLSGGTSQSDVWAIATGIRPFGECMPATFDTSAPGCPTALANPRLTTDTGALLNASFVMNMSGFDPLSSLAIMSVGFAPATQNCNLATASLGHVSANSNSFFLAAGSGSFSLFIPNSINFSGLVFFAQAFNLDSANNFVLTNQITATAGL